MTDTGAEEAPGTDDPTAFIRTSFDPWQDRDPGSNAAIATLDPRRLKWLSAQIGHRFTASAADEIGFIEEWKPRMHNRELAKSITSFIHTHAGQQTTMPRSREDRLRLLFETVLRG